MTLDKDVLPKHVPLRAHASPQDKRRDLEHHIARKLSELKSAIEVVKRSTMEGGRLNDPLTARIEEIWQSAGLSHVHVQSSNFSEKVGKTAIEGPGSSKEGPEMSATSLIVDNENEGHDKEGDLLTALSDPQEMFDEIEWMSAQYQYLLQGE